MIGPRLAMPRALLAVAGSLLALCSAELGVRWFDIGPDFQVVYREVYQLSDDPVLGYELRAGAPDGPGRINSAGFRDREFPRSKPPGVFRIVAIGDSVTFGSLEEPLESWTKHLERALNERARGVTFEVLNLGVTGYNVTRVAERLRVLGLEYQPDLVLYGYVLNDPQAGSLESLALMDRKAQAELRFSEAVERGALRWLSGSRLFLLGASLLGDEAECATPARTRPRPALPAAITERVARGEDLRGGFFRALHEGPEPRARLRAGLERIAELTRAAGVPVVGVIFPVFFPPDERGYPLGDVHAFVAGELRSRGFWTVDLQPVFASAESRGLDCSHDSLHPNRLGNQLAAGALLEELERLGLLPDGSLAAGSTGLLPDARGIGLEPGAPGEVDAIGGRLALR
jgi:lysophospholipase L1-like esterase